MKRSLRCLPYRCGVVLLSCFAEYLDQLAETLPGEKEPSMNSNRQAVAQGFDLPPNAVRRTDDDRWRTMPNDQVDAVRDGSVTRGHSTQLTDKLIRHEHRHGTSARPVGLDHNLRRQLTLLHR